MISINNIFRTVLFGRSIPQLSAVLVYRSLYSPSALGLENYVKTRERVKIQFDNVEEKFRTKMSDSTETDSNSMVFTEDLKHMIHLIDANGNDLALIRLMMLKFARQNKDLRFGSFVFGPVVMRMYHHLNQAKEALEMFTNPEMDGFFDQLMTFQILMDLLFKNNMFKEMIDVFEIVKIKQVQGAKYPKNAVVLVIAACYKLNSPESFTYVKELWSELTKIGHYPMRRSGTFAAALALNQNSPHIALEILGSMKQQTYVTVRNLKVAALADLNRPDDAFPILRAVTQLDSNTDRRHTFSEEIIAKLIVSVNKLGKSDVKHEFEKLEQQLRALNSITSEPLDTQLCSEINAVVHQQNDRRGNRFITDRPPQRIRQGLEDMF